MKGHKTAVVAHKKLNSEMLKTHKPTKEKKDKASKKNSTTKDPEAPKRPASAYFVFMEEFRKSFKENYPDNKSISAVSKAGGEKWQSMSASEKAPYVEKALKRKAEYEKARDVYATKKRNDEGNGKPEESGKSSSEVHDEDEQEVSS